MALPACPVCGTENNPNARFCIDCGSRLAAAGCPVCGTVNQPEARFCMNCGTALAAEGAGVRPGGPIAPLGVPTAERRLVSVLFVDLVGFTAASEGRDAEDTRELLTRYYDAARGIVARYGGTIEKFIGDAVMALWGSPSAHEDDAERAVRAALEIVSAVSRLEVADGQLQARAGVLTGEAAVELGLEGQGMIAGDLVNTASRLQSAARPGSVLVGEATYRAASLAIAFESAGERELKGKSAPVPVWEAVSVVARRGGEGRAAMLEPPFVGRDDELQLLKDLFHATAREGKPRLVTVSGVAGIGKSRLLWEFEKYLDGIVEDVYLHTGRSPAYGEGVSYWALVEMVRGRCGIVDADDPDTARHKVRETIARFIPDEADRRWIEPRVSGLLGLEQLPGEGREELFAAWRTLFERMADQGPVVLGFWDVQWADQGTLDFIEHVLSWARSSAILVLAEARPELFDRRLDWGRSQRSATLMHLGPITAPDMERLLRGLVPALPPEPLRRIIERAEGVPLYAVETLRMLVDQQVLVPEGSHLTLSRELPELAVPQTLHALIAARLDALSPEERALLTQGSVLGLSFTLPSLVAVSGLPPETVERLVNGLLRRELLVLDADARSPERGQYRFVQGVVREIAYQSIARKNRQATHLAAARYFESLGDDELAGVLASHYLAAYQAAPAGPGADALAAQARVALRAAADRATALHDLVGALSSLEQALAVTPDAAEQAALHEAAITVGGHAAQFARAHEHGEAAVAIYQARGDRLGVIRARALQSSVIHMEHHDQIAIQALLSVLADAADLPPSPEIAAAQTELARGLMLSGSPEAIEWCDRVLAHPEVAPPDVLLEALITKGTALSNFGRDVEAEALLRGSVALADEAGNLAAGLRARNNLRVVTQWSNLPYALVLAREVRDIARKFGIRAWVLHGISSSQDVTFRLGTFEDLSEEERAEMVDAGDFYGAWLELEQSRRQIYRGDPRAAERDFDRGLQLPAMATSAQATTWNLAAKADALIPQGRFDEAYNLAVEARATSAERELPLLAALFAAAASGNTERLGQVREDALVDGLDRRPAGRGYLDVADALAAALEGRWDDARAALARAVPALEAVGEGLVLGRFRLALGHIAGDHMPEAREAAAAADAYFAGLGATHYAEAYRRHAVRWSGEAGEGGITGVVPAGEPGPVRTAR